MALRERRPVVALESAVITSGLPRESINDLLLDDARWRRDRPVNLEAGLLMARTIRDFDAVPAAVAVIDGVLHIGLDDDSIEQLALDENAGKASISNLAHCCAAGRTAGTTVSATLHACEMASIRVFATGGIGGVHRRGVSAVGSQPPAPSDISADLLMIAKTSALIVSAGAKSILDLPATLEALETLGVPVLGFGTNRFPQFYSSGTDELPLGQRVDSAQDAAAFCRLHWEQLKIRGGILLANPIDETYAVEEIVVDELVRLAEAKAASQRVGGAARTPFLLEELARLSGGRTLRANLALLKANAALAGQVAVELAASGIGS